MSTPQGPDQPWEGQPPSYEQQPYQQQPDWQQQPPQQGWQQPQQDWQQSQQGWQQPQQPQQEWQQPQPSWQQPNQGWPQDQQQGQQGQYAQPQWQQNNQWQQPYGYQQGPKPPTNRTPLIIATAAFLVIVLAIVGVVLLTGDDDKKQAGPPAPPTPSYVSPPAPTTSAPTSSASSQSTTPSPAPSGSTPTSVEQITVTPTIKGWHGVLSYKENVAYDVPPGFKPETPGTLVGFENSSGNPIAIMHGVSTYKDEACPKVRGSYRGRVGFRTAGDADATSAARSAVQAFSDGVALKDNGKFAPVSAIKLSSVSVGPDKIPAKYARATVTLNDKSDCGSPTVVVVSVAFRLNSSTTAAFVGYFDQGVSDALNLKYLSKIFSTIRVYKR